MEQNVNLSIDDVSKRFGATHALRAVSFDVQAGSVHALLGHNGSGKSTLIKILSGYHSRDSGRISVQGLAMPREVDAAVVRRLGVRFVHQDLGLVEALSAGENLALYGNYVRGRTRGISWAGQRRAAQAILDQVGARFSPDDTVSDLGPVDKTLLAIARAIQDMDVRNGILVLDEPTARLPGSEVSRVLGIVRTLRDRGASVLYVTHRLDEVFEVADHVTVLQNGEKLVDGPLSSTSPGSIRKAIAASAAGSGLKTVGARPSPVVRGDLALSLRGIQGRTIKHLDLDLYAGEIVAITGTVGSGRSELGRLLYGLQPIAAGSMTVGRSGPMTRMKPEHARLLGLGYTPQERTAGLALGETVAENIAFPAFRNFCELYGVSKRRIDSAARSVIDEMSIRPPSTETRLAVLSGGNQQKVSIGKWVRLMCTVLILDEPLQGIDIGAKEDIMRILRAEVTARSSAVLWIESDAETIPEHADRAIVLSRGEIVGELEGTDLNRDNLLEMLYAGKAVTA